jgi:hypothetical protein
LKRRPLATNFIGNATKTPNVTLEVIWLSTDDFRTNIDWSPNLSGSEIYARTRKKTKAHGKLKAFEITPYSILIEEFAFNDKHFLGLV